MVSVRSPARSGLDHEQGRIAARVEVYFSEILVTGSKCTISPFISQNLSYSMFILNILRSILAISKSRSALSFFYTLTWMETRSAWCPSFTLLTDTIGHCIGGHGAYKVKWLVYLEAIITNDSNLPLKLGFILFT